MIRGILVVVFILASNFVFTQELSPIDQRKRDAIDNAIDLSPEQAMDVDSIFTYYSHEFNKLDLQIKEVESDTSYTEDQVLVRVNMLNQEKKDLRELRELDVKQVLTSEQLVIYDEKVQPAKPQVLHFGIHNRADCKVCTK